MILLELALLLGLAWPMSKLAERTAMPGVLGALAAGVLAGQVLFPLLPGPGPGPTLAVVSPHLRMAVLAVVLLRVGFSLNPAELRSAGGLALSLGLVPMLGDALGAALAATLLLDMALPAALCCGFLVAAISPAIVIPGLMELLERRTGRARRLPTALLVGAPLDNIAAVLALGAVLDLAVSGGGEWTGALGRLPLQVAGGVLLGAAAGWPFARLLPARFAAGPTGATLLWAVGLGLILACQRLGLSAVLAVLACGFTVQLSAPYMVRGLALGLSGIWNWAQLLLFGLIGAAVNLGPLRQAGLLYALVILAGQGGRALASSMATAGAGLSRNERLACVLAYLPKATIQAAFAGLPLSRGLPEGEALLTLAAMAIVLTAPLGTIALHRGADRLLPHN